MSVLLRPNSFGVWRGNGTPDAHGWATDGVLQLLADEAGNLQRKPQPLSEHAATDRDNHVTALGFSIGQPGIHMLHRFQGLVLLSCRHLEDVRRNTRSLQCELGSSGVTGRTLVADDVRCAGGKQALEALAKLV